MDSLDKATNAAPVDVAGACTVSEVVKDPSVHIDNPSQELKNVESNKCEDGKVATNQFKNVSFIDETSVELEEEELENFRWRPRGKPIPPIDTGVKKPKPEKPVKKRNN